MTARVWLGITAWALASTAVPAFAYSDPLTFSDPVQVGGGGGRFFTGSATDGYGCGVCHSGGPSAKLLLVGLPLAGYRPSTAYEVRVEWPVTLDNLGLALEITDQAGVAAGVLRLPPDTELPSEERCSPSDGGQMAGVLTELTGRTLLSVPDCGARRVRFLWTSPAEARGTLRFSGGFVVSNGNADAAGDGVTLFSHQLPPARRGPQPVSEIGGGCSVASPTRRASRVAGDALLLIAGVVALGTRMRRRR